MTRRDLLELGRLCLRAVRYGLAAAVFIFAGILLIGWWRQ
jgi:hypothetical protein